MMSSICFNISPFTLFHELLSHSVLERRKPFNPHFLDMSRRRIGKQSLANHVNAVSMKMNFKWLQVKMSPQTLRNNLFSHTSISSSN